MQTGMPFIIKVNSTKVLPLEEYRNTPPVEGYYDYREQCWITPMGIPLIATAGRVAGDKTVEIDKTLTKNGKDTEADVTDQGKD